MCVYYLDIISVPYKIYACDKNNFKTFLGEFKTFVIK